LEEDYRQSIHLCPVDLRKFQILLDFDVLERYAALERFYSCYHMHDSLEWVKDMIHVLKKRKVDAVEVESESRSKR